MPGGSHTASASQNAIIAHHILLNTVPDSATFGGQAPVWKSRRSTSRRVTGSSPQLEPKTNTNANACTPSLSVYGRCKTGGCMRTKPPPAANTKQPLPCSHQSPRHTLSNITHVTQYIEKHSPTASPAILVPPSHLHSPWPAFFSKLWRSSLAPSLNHTPHPPTTSRGSRGEGPFRQLRPATHTLSPPPHRNNKEGPDAPTARRHPPFHTPKPTCPRRRHPPPRPPKPTPAHTPTPEAATRPCTNPPPPAPPPL